MCNIIYIADDDKNICNILKSNLENEQYEVEIFLNADSLLKRFEKKWCDLIITDIMMPGMSGYDLCKEIRKRCDVPIIMLSAKGEEIDRVLGLELGSDDYISKPFSLREVTAKVRNILRRRNNSQTFQNTKEFLICRDLEIWKENRQIFIHGTEFEVTTKEYDLLNLLVEHRNKAFTREEIIEKIWGYDYFGETRQVDHVIKRLRKKMLLAETDCKIETIWGYGYKVSD
jgi:DNA-binding response OmpR family regulator